MWPKCGRVVQSKKDVERRVRPKHVRKVDSDRKSEDKNSIGRPVQHGRLSASACHPLPKQSSAALVPEEGNVTGPERGDRSVFRQMEPLQLRGHRIGRKNGSGRGKVGCFRQHRHPSALHSRSSALRSILTSASSHADAEDQHHCAQPANRICRHGHLLKSVSTERSNRTSTRCQARSRSQEARTPA